MRLDYNKGWMDSNGAVLIWTSMKAAQHAEQRRPQACIRARMGAGGTAKSTQLA